MNKLTKIILVAGAAMLGGCSTQLGKFTLYSPETIDLSKGEYCVDKSAKVKGVDPSRLYLVFASPDVPSYDQAVRNAMSERKGCVGLADVTLSRKSFWLLFGYCDFIAEGYPVVKKEVK